MTEELMFMLQTDQMRDVWKQLPATKSLGSSGVVYGSTTGCSKSPATIHPPYLVPQESCVFLKNA